MTEKEIAEYLKKISPRVAFIDKLEKVAAYVVDVVAYNEDGNALCFAEVKERSIDFGEIGSGMIVTMIKIMAATRLGAISGLPVLALTAFRNGDVYWADYAHWDRDRGLFRVVDRGTGQTEPHGLIPWHEFHLVQ